MTYGIGTVNEASGSPREITFEVSGTSSGTPTVDIAGVQQVEQITVDPSAFSEADGQGTSEQHALVITGSSGNPFESATSANTVNIAGSTSDFGSNNTEIYTYPIKLGNKTVGYSSRALSTPKFFFWEEDFSNASSTSITSFISNFSFNTRPINTNMGQNPFGDSSGTNSTINPATEFMDSNFLIGCDGEQFVVISGQDPNKIHYTEDGETWYSIDFPSTIPSNYRPTNSNFSSAGGFAGGEGILLYTGWDESTSTHKSFYTTTGVQGTWIECSSFIFRANSSSFLLKKDISNNNLEYIYVRNFVKTPGYSSYFSAPKLISYLYDVNFTSQESTQVYFDTRNNWNILSVSRKNNGKINLFNFEKTNIAMTLSPGFGYYLNFTRFSKASSVLYNNAGDNVIVDNFLGFYEDESNGRVYGVKLESNVSETSLNVAYIPYSNPPNFNNVNWGYNNWNREYTPEMLRFPSNSSDRFQYIILEDYVDGSNQNFYNSSSNNIGSIVSSRYNNAALSAKFDSETNNIQLWYLGSSNLNYKHVPLPVINFSETESGLDNTTITLKHMLTSSTQLRDELKDKIPSSITNNFSIANGTYSGNPSVTLTANNLVNYNFSMSINTANISNLTFTTAKIRDIVLPSEFSSAIKIKLGNSINSRETLPVLFLQSANANEIASLIGSWVSDKTDWTYSVNNNVVTLNAPVDSGNILDAELTVFTSGSSNLEDSDFSVNTTVQGVTETYTNGFISATDGIHNVIKKVDNKNVSEVSDILEDVINEITTYYVTSTSNNTVTATSIKRSPDPDLDVTIVNGSNGDINVSKTVNAQGQLGDLVEVPDYLPRIVKIFTTTTSNGSISIPDFDSNAGHFFVVPEDNSSYNAREQVLVHPSLSFNNSTKIMSWTFPSVSDNPKEFIAPNFDRSGTFKNTAKVYCIQYKGEPNTNDYGFYIKGPSNEVSVDSKVSNIAKAILKIAEDNNNELWANRASLVTGTFTSGVPTDRGGTAVFTYPINVLCSTLDLDSKLTFFDNSVWEEENVIKTIGLRNNKAGIATLQDGITYGKIEAGEFLGLTVYAQSESRALIHYNDIQNTIMAPGYLTTSTPAQRNAVVAPLIESGDTSVAQSIDMLALSTRRYKDPSVSHGIEVFEDSSSNKVAFNSYDVYPKVVYAEVLNASVLSTTNIYQVYNINHPSVSRPYYSFYKSVDPYLFFVGEGRDYADSEFHGVYASNGNSGWWAIVTPCIRRISNTQSQIYWGMVSLCQDTNTGNDGFSQVYSSIWSAYTQPPNSWPRSEATLEPLSLISGTQPQFFVSIFDLDGNTDRLNDTTI